MKKLLATVGLSLFTLTSGVTFANEQICGEVNLQEKIQSNDYSMAFRNHGGLMNGGVCWWHSRWHRNAVYLAYFSPEKDKPEFDTKKERKENNGEGLSVKEIIKTIKAGDEVVEIPGYRNLREFTAENYKMIQDTLEGWQKEDGFLNQKWLIGAFKKKKTNPEKLQSKMEKLYKQVEVEGNIVYQMLQMKGIDAHAWLVVGVDKQDNGYELTVVDSNYPMYTTKAFYRNGDKSVTGSYGYGRFLPHTGNRGEERGLKKARRKFCEKLEKDS